MNEGPKRKERKRESNKAKEKKELCLLLILIYLILLSLCPLTVSLCSSCSSLFSLIFQFSHSGDPQPRFHPVNSGEDENTHTRARARTCMHARKHKRPFRRRVIASIAMGKEGREQVSLWIKPRLLTQPWW